MAAPSNRFHLDVFGAVPEAIGGVFVMILVAMPVVVASPIAQQVEHDDSAHRECHQHPRRKEASRALFPGRNQRPVVNFVQIVVDAIGTESLSPFLIDVTAAVLVNGVDVLVGERPGKVDLVAIVLVLVGFRVIIEVGRKGTRRG